MSLFKCGRDSTGIKCRTCIVGDSCRKEVRWFRKKAEMEAHLKKAHNIRVILPRGLKIEEEEKSTSMKSTTTSFFSNYERQRTIRRFLDPELKYNRSRQLYMRKLKTRAIKIFQSHSKHTSNIQGGWFHCLIHQPRDGQVRRGEEHRMAKLKLKVTVAFESYISMVNDYMCILCESKSSVNDYVWILCMNFSVRIMGFPCQKMWEM